MFTCSPLAMDSPLLALLDSVSSSDGSESESCDIGTKSERVRETLPCTTFIALSILQNERRSLTSMRTMKKKKEEKKKKKRKKKKKEEEEKEEEEEE